MSTVHEQYTEEMRRQFGYFASWLPDTRLALGDIGLLTRRRFDRFTSLSALGIDFGVSQGLPGGELEYASEGGVRVAVDADGAIAAGTGVEQAAAVSVTFERPYATYFRATGCAVERIEDLRLLAERLRKLATGDRWQRNWVVVTEVVRCASGTVLVSQQHGARAEFRVSAGASGPVQPGRVSGGLSLVSTSGLAFRAVAQAGLTPLFRAARLRASVTTTPRLVFRSDTPAEASGSDGLVPDDDTVLVEPAWDEIPLR